MKTKVFFVIAIIAFATSMNFAQPMPPHPSKGAQLRHLKMELNLSDEQVKKVDEIMKNNRTKIDQIQDKMDEQQSAQMDEMKNLMDNQEKDIEKILTPEQKQKYAEIKKEREKMHPKNGYPRPMGDEGENGRRPEFPRQ